MNARIARMDIGVFVTSLLMVGLGVVLVYSSSFAVAQQRYGGADFFLSRQAIRALLALCCFMVFINIDYHVWGKYSHIIFPCAIGLLVLALALPGGHAVKGARRWIALGPISFQASEVARMALVIVLAKKVGEEDVRIGEWKRFVSHLARIGIICGLILIEPNFSTCLILAIVGLAVLFVGGARLSHIAGLFIVLVPAALAALLAAPYRFRRMTAFLHKAEHQNDIGYQAYQAIIGLGNGGLFGRGLGQGEEKFFYLPEPHTDFVFSIIGEEFGFIGLVAVLSLFGYLLYRGMKIAANAPDRMGQLMAFGFTFMLTMYVAVHAGVNTGLIPTTGVPLPFLSYGGMSLAFTMSGIGILLNISSQSARQELSWDGRDKKTPGARGKRPGR